jgi:cell division protein FtsL
MEEGSMSRPRAGVLRAGLAFAGLLLSLSYVIWRQSRALELLRALDRVHVERAGAEAERSELMQRIEILESRSHVVMAAGARLGMRVPSANDIVILPLTAASTAGGSR